MSNGQLRLVDLTDRAGEPRVQDLRLAEALEFSDPHKIRNLIQRHKDRLARLGEVSATMAETLPQGGRPSTEYWLNEKQATFIAMRADTARAADVQIEIIEVFHAYRHGDLVPSTEAISRVIDSLLRPLTVRTIRIEERLEEIAAENKLNAQYLRQIASSRRRRPSGADVRTIERFALLHNGGCPCCRRCDVLDAQGERINDAQIDHFFSVDQAALHSTWLICGECHQKLTSGGMPRKMAAHRFAAYQELLDTWLQADAGPLFGLEPAAEAPPPPPYVAETVPDEAPPSRPSARRSSAIIDDRQISLWGAS